MNLKRNLLITFVILITWSGTIFAQRPDLPAPARRADPTLPPGLSIDEYIVPFIILAIIIGIVFKFKKLRV